MPKPPKLIMCFLRALLLVTAVTFPYSSVAAQTSYQPCIQFLKSIAADNDQPLLDLYIQSVITPDEAKKRLLSLTRKVNPAHSTARQALYLLIQYNIEQAEGDNDAKAMGYISQLKQLGEQTNSKWMIAEAVLAEAAELVDKRNYELAESMLSRVEILAREIGYHSLLARTLKWQGNIYIDRSDYKLGLQSYQNAYEIFSSCGDKLQIARVLSNISTVYIRMEEWSKADHYINQAIDLYHEQAFSNPFAEAILHINASVIDKYLERPEKRLAHIREAMVLAAKTSSYRVKLTALMNLAATQLDHNKPQKALESSLACLRLAESFNEPRGIANCNESLAESYLQLNQTDKALEHAFLALDTYEQRGNRKRYIYVSNIIADIYEITGDYKLALKYYKQYAVDGKEYLFDVRRKELFDLQERFEAKEKEHEIILLKTENSLKSARLAEQEASENMLKIGTAFILFILYFLYRRYTSISRNNVALELSNAELATQSMQDPLTCLYNRRYLEKWLKTASSQPALKTTLAVLLDIDHFKSINDKLGHDVGDQVLILLAQRLKNASCNGDLNVRWGGEEFVLILNTTEYEADSVLECLRLAIAETPFLTNVGEVTVTVSMGAVFIRSPQQLESEWESILVAADKALYSVKSAGRNGFKLVTC
ncbi:GGDEF domain-containing protein [Photobacterium chitinilyticum]|uniref:diguanylate cyclase n=1 Tax=Photobacterium chitinilyticum TaxID=2485123 RepID=A0A3S3QRH7_9GAMM|nr:GGDEF domain-containing protein [Photobacterium chitinilyticum]RWX57051.1 diguanylate cyclase [Photobacterium chitinilyticum]